MSEFDKQEVRRLRREVEQLKAQLAQVKPVEEPKKKKKK